LRSLVPPVKLSATLRIGSLFIATQDDDDPPSAAMEQINELEPEHPMDAMRAAPDHHDVLHIIAVEAKPHV